MASTIQELRGRAGQIVRHPRTKRVAIWIVSLFVAVGILGALAAPPLLRHKLAAELSKKLHRDVAIQQVRINPYALSVTIRGFSMKERNGSANAAAFDELYLNAEIQSLIQWALVIKELRLSKPYIHLIRNDDRTYNFQDLIDEFTTGPQGGLTPRFSLRNIEVIDGKVDFDDRPEQTKHTLSSIHIGVPFLSNLPHYANVKVKPAFSALLNGAPMQIVADTEPFQARHETTIQLNIDKVQIPKYLSYFPVELNFGVPTGEIDGRVRASFRTYEDKPPVLAISGNLTLKELVLQLRDERPLLKLPSLELAITDFELFAHRAAFRLIKAQGLELSLRRDRSGRLNLASLVQRPEASGRSDPKKEDASFSYQVGELLLESSTLHFVDEVSERPYETTLNNVHLNVKNLTNEPQKRADVELSFESEVKERFNTKRPPGKAATRAENKKGTARFIGTAGVNPIAGQFKVEAQDLELPPLQPYLAEKVNFVVTEGRAGTQGDLSVESPIDGPLRVAYEGSLRVTDFAALDRDTSQDLFKWKSLEVPALQLIMLPLRLRANEINLADFYARIFIAPDGKFNLQKLAAEEENPLEETVAPETPSKHEAPAQSSKQGIVIGKINLKGGDVHFSDLFIKPNYSANLTAVQATISELKPEAPGDLDIRAKLDNATPVEVRGKINPFGKNLFMDLNGNATDIDLISLSPYSGRYLGYGLSGGKLSFQVHYQLADRGLEGENKIILNQLTFGEKVESPQATELPVLLAVALLKDRNGVIDVNLPIGGSLDDPEFSVGGIVLRLILNIIAKAVTSPFTLLGSIFGGGGEELSYIEFEPGRSDLTPTALSRLKTLATAMDNRPALKLEISGRFDPVDDLEGLKRVGIERKVKAQKMKQLTRQGAAPDSVDDVQINGDEYERFLKAAYGEEKFPKPRNILGLAKDLPVPEIESLMFKYASVSDDDLGQLANRRAQTARDYLLERGQIGMDRLFIVASKMGGGEKDKNGKSTRVDFALR